MWVHRGWSGVGISHEWWNEISSGYSCFQELGLFCCGLRRGRDLEPDMTESDQPRPYAGDVFATTHWSVVLKARLSDAAASQMAMEQLCRAYWPPIYSYIRRDGYRPEDA